MAPRNSRRTDALSKKRIVDAAIDILDTDGESALTFRALAVRLSTGSGAIYWHVANRTELLTAATAQIVATAVTEPAEAGNPRANIRAVTSRVFDAIDAHPWVGTQLSLEPWQPALTDILERIGRQMGALGVPEEAQFDASTAVVSHILGLASQYAAGARLLAPETDRPAFLTAIADGWAQLDAERYPFLREVAGQLSQHDDREQFLAGIDYILTGIEVSTGRKSM